MNREMYALIAIIVMALVTALLRFLPFLVLGNRQTPKFLEYLAKVLPYAAMGMLVVYCLKDISFTASPFALPEIISVAVVVLLHLWRKNTLLSIVMGTGCYMVLINVM